MQSHGGEYAHNSQVAQRFFNEARAANLIEHPALVQISEFGQLPDGSTYLVMDCQRAKFCWGCPHKCAKSCLRLPQKIRYDGLLLEKTMAQQIDPQKSGKSSDAATSDSEQGDASQPLLTPNTLPTTEESEDDSARNNGKLNPSF